MAIDLTIAQALNAAFNASDIKSFRKLLIAHPEFLRHADGTDRWMYDAAMVGSLKIIKALVSLGMDVNEPKDIADPKNPFCTVEGPIVWAASEGQLAVVKWLLANGAKINYTVNGTPRCMPLLFAAARGHLAVVKLLVENGADRESSWNGHTALSQAENYGHRAIAKYLKSLKRN